MKKALWLGVGALGVLTVLLSAHSREARDDAPTAPVPTPSSSIPAWKRKVVSIVAASEGRTDSLNRNLDGNGLSFGLIQWTQRSGSLGVLLRAMAETDPAAFRRLFGPSAAMLLATVEQKSLEPVDGAVLWNEPWASRFVAAGRYPAFVEVQWRLALRGEYFRGAETVAAILGLRTERAMAMYFDRCVHQGPATAATVARELHTALVADGPIHIAASELLARYAAACAARFRRTSPPADPAYSKHSPNVRWVPVGAEWHAKAGPWDLYTTIVERTSRLRADPRLSDAPLGAA